MLATEEELAARAKRRVGTFLKGKWHVDAVVGVGGMAAVFAATHRNGSRVALKVLHPELSTDADIRRRFLREGYAANAVAHPGVVRVIDDDVTEDGAAFLLMDLLEGETLERRAERAQYRMPVGEVVHIATAVLDVLAAAHDKGVVHRDIKPANVFLTNDGKVRVLDFGIAQMRDAGNMKGFATKSGSMLGTPAFMSPEQALGRPGEIDARSDVWAVASTMFLLLSGRPVHPSEVLNEQLVLAATRRAPPLAEVAPHVPAAIATVIDRGLAFEREARFQSAREMEAALVQAAGLEPDLLAALPPAPPPILAAPPSMQTAPVSGHAAPPASAPFSMRGGTLVAVANSPSGSSVGPAPAPPKGNAALVGGVLGGVALLSGAAIVVMLLGARGHKGGPVAGASAPPPTAVEAAPDATALGRGSGAAQAPADAGVFPVSSRPTASGAASAAASASGRAPRVGQPRRTPGSWLDERR